MFLIKKSIPQNLADKTTMLSAHTILGISTCNVFSNVEERVSIRCGPTVSLRYCSASVGNLLPVQHPWQQITNDSNALDVFFRCVAGARRSHREPFIPPIDPDQGFPVTTSLQRT